MKAASEIKIAQRGILTSSVKWENKKPNFHNDDNFRWNEIGCKKPDILGLGKSKLIKFIKD